MKWKQCLAAFALLASALEGKEAFGYCRTSTCGSELAADCADRSKCEGGGIAVYWPSREVTINVENGSDLRQISAEVAQRILSESMGAWTRADCGHGQTPSVAVTPVQLLSSLGYDKTWRRDVSVPVNTLRFLDDGWPHDPDAIALTTVRYGTETGKILAAEIEANSYGHDVTVVDSGGDFDLQSLLTHEAGHFFGLSHVHESDATMYAAYAGGGNVDRRSLAKNDIDGICAVYPPNRFDDAAGCGCRTGREGRTGPGASVALLGLGMLFRRRKGHP